MSTRAFYTFIGSKASGSPHNFNVYKHHDGYPSGARDTLQMAIDWFAWRLPRYESDEFATAFIAAGKIRLDEKTGTIQEEYRPGGEYRKHSGGGVRLMPSGNPTKVAARNASDIQYRYEISEKNGELYIKVYDGNWWETPTNPIKETLLFDGTFEAWSLSLDAEKAA